MTNSSAPESQKVVEFINSLQTPELLKQIIAEPNGDPEAARIANSIISASKSAGGSLSVDQLMTLPGVTLETVLRIHSAITANNLVGLITFGGIGDIIRRIIEEWIKTNCQRTAGQTAWECVNGKMTLMDTDTYTCPDGSRHTIRTIRERSNQPC